MVFRVVCFCSYFLTYIHQISDSLIYMMDHDPWTSGADDSTVNEFTWIYFLKSDDVFKSIFVFGSNCFGFKFPVREMLLEQLFKIFGFQVFSQGLLVNDVVFVRGFLKHLIVSLSYINFLEVYFHLNQTITSIYNMLLEFPSHQMVLKQCFFNIFTGSKFRRTEDLEEIVKQWRNMRQTLHDVSSF